MALRFRQRKIYTDLASIYRSTAEVVTAFGPKAYTLITADVPGKLYTTTNFDQPLGGFALKKDDNLETANRWHNEASIDNQSQDMMKITQGPAGVTKWFLVSGEPETRYGVANRSEVRLIPTPFNEANIH